MNYKLKYDLKTPSFLDKQRANKKLNLLYYKKRFNDFLYKNEKNYYIGSSYK